PTDAILVELIALDYYLQHKIKPATRFLPDIETAQRQQAFASLGLNHHKYRYAMHNVHFNVQRLVTSGTIEPQPDLLVVEFSGVEVPRVVV
ncbi:MAG: hypothetical protein RBS81_12400, partial [Tenuifilaceae bacterium]|nr:hypothetical protein [Tenuifilaceae bacterium]